MPDATQVADLLRRGIATAQAGRKQEAHQMLLRVTELDERNEQAWLWLSEVVESFEDRRICLENVLTINPDNSHAQAGLRWLDQQSPALPTTPERCPLCKFPIPPSGKVCPRCGQVLIVACPGCWQYVDVREVSCPECGRHLGNFRDGARYHLALAKAYLEQQRFDLVQETVVRAEMEAADDPQVLEGVAALHEEMGHTDAAISAYKRAIERDSGNAALYVRLGTIYRQRAMAAETRAMFEQAAKRASDDPAILSELARLYIEDGATVEALKLLERAVRLDPEHAQTHSLLSDLYLSRGQGAKAVQHYERVCELTTPDSLLGREARRKLGKLRPSMPRQAQGWGETLRRVSGLMLPPMLAALVNARFRPQEISLVAWIALVAASVGTYLWTCAADVPRNPMMRALFGKAGVKELWQKALVGAPGVLLWVAALGLILGRV
ncbi:MAG: tetratricopeptide repeat protein [Chloroflexi bacterium]|nr:tetratricopeptide repeat protein [Chloroflexota bacterium]